MWVALVLFVVGMSLSALFSGSETGFYRVSRVRLLIDALAGDATAKRLLWASNNPAAFVATALVGNNVANYLTSRAVVMAAGVWFPGAAAAEVLLPLAVTPFVFIYGELLPKRFFFEAPYRLLRRCVPVLMVAGALFSAVSALLWLVSRALELISKTPTPTIRMELARRELGEVLAEGHAVGLLAPAQQRIAQAAITLGGRSIRGFMTPAARNPRVPSDVTAGEALRIARRQRGAALPVEDAAHRGGVVGYVSAVDCLLAEPSSDLPIRPIAEVRETDGYLASLLKLQESGEPIAVVRNAGGRLVGFVTTERLREAMLAGG